MSNLNLSRLPTSFDQADAELGHKPSKRVAYATTLQRFGESIALVHHCTPILTFHADGSATADCAGWRSHTTKYRLTRALWRSDWSIGAVRRVWYWYHRGALFCEYRDGDRVYLERSGAPGREGIR